MKDRRCVEQESEVHGSPGRITCWNCFLPRRKLDEPCLHCGEPELSEPEPPGDVWREKSGDLLVGLIAYLLSEVLFGFSGDRSEMRSRDEESDA